MSDDVQLGVHAVRPLLDDINDQITAAIGRQYAATSLADPAKAREMVAALRAELAAWEQVYTHLGLGEHVVMWKAVRRSITATRTELWEYERRAARLAGGAS